MHLHMVFDRKISWTEKKRSSHSDIAPWYEELYRAVHSTYTIFCQFISFLTMNLHKCRAQVVAVSIDNSYSWEDTYKRGRHKYYHLTCSMFRWGRSARSRWLSKYNSFLPWAVVNTYIDRIIVFVVLKARYPNMWSFHTLRWYHIRRSTVFSHSFYLIQN